MDDKQKVSICWNNYGKSEPYWSVLTGDIFKINKINDGIKNHFYQSGKNDADWFFSLLPPSFAPKSILDYGCGVGRITGWINGAHGCDISIGHLEIAKQKCPSNTFHLVEPGQCPHSHSYDFIYSVMVLQHCRPNLIKECVTNILTALNPGGYAALHIPYHMPSPGMLPDHIHEMEMHSVPKEEIFAIITSSNCTMEAIHEIDRCGGGIKNCVYVIRKN